MKTFILSLLFATFSLASFAQTKSETIQVAGECGMCKSTIETAAKKAGATHAVWNTETKLLSVKYASGKSSTQKIEKAVAAAGYDTPDFRATDAAYDKLHACCKYDRSASPSKSCCADAKCAEHACMKDGKCAKDMSCCKDSGCSEKDCCKH